jgi:hypothetical protein
LHTPSIMGSLMIMCARIIGSFGGGGEVEMESVE